MSSCRPSDPSSDQLRSLRTAHALAQFGDGAFYVTSAAYLARLGWSLNGIGLLLGICWGAGALASRRIGRLGDRRGLVRISALAVGGCAAGLLGLAIAPDAVVVGIAYLVYAISQSAWGGLRAALTQMVAEPQGAVAARARLQTIGNGAVAAGAVIGGISLAADGVPAMRAAIAVDAILYVAASVIVRSITADAPRPRAAGPTAAPGRTDRPTARQLIATLAAAALYLYMPTLSVALPLMITHNPRIPAWSISACFLANTIGVMALQRRTATAITTPGRARHAVAVGGVLLAASTAVLWTATHSLRAPAPLIAGGLGAGVVVQVLGEVRFAAGAWDLGYRLAPTTGAAAWQATYGAAVPIARSVGPAVLAPLAAAPAGWLAPAVLFLVGAAGLVGATAGPSISHPFVEQTGSTA